MLNPILEITEILSILRESRQEMDIERLQLADKMLSVKVPDTPDYHKYHRLIGGKKMVDAVIGDLEQLVEKLHNDLEDNTDERTSNGP